MINDYCSKKKNNTIKAAFKNNVPRLPETFNSNTGVANLTYGQNVVYSQVGLNVAYQSNGNNEAGNNNI